MSLLAGLGELSRLAECEEDTASAVSAALRRVEAALTASAAFLVYGVEDDFRYFDEAVPLELSRNALWLTNRALTSRSGPVAFRVRYGRVADFGEVAGRRAYDHVAMILPTARTTAHMLIAQGDWESGLSKGQREFLSAAAPALGLLLQRRLKIVQAESDHVELSTLFSVGRVISETEELPTMLTRLASSVASLAGVTHAVIDLLGGDGNVRLRCMNNDVAAASPWIERWTRAAQRPDPVRNIVVATKQPMIFEDAQNDERIPERGRAFFTSTLIRSTALFPLVVRDSVVGVLSLASARPCRFEGRQREIIEGVAAQIATAVHGVQLYDDRVEAEAALRRSQDLLSATIESTADGILAVDKGGHVIYANRRFAEMWRIPDAVMADEDDQRLIEYVLSQLDDPEAWLAKVRALYASTEESFDTLTFKDGRVFERFSRALLQGDRAAGRVWSFRDVTERHRTEQLLVDQARRDSLTNLLNHAAISEALRDAAATAQLVTVVVVDVDGMKAVNDAYGHVVGDEVLVAVARTLAREGALVGRYGGDEFVVVLPDADRAAAERYCRRVTRALARVTVRDPVSDSRVPVAVSMGLAVYPTEVRYVEDAIRVADDAMYLEKRERATTPDAARGRLALADERVARMIGELVPVLTSSARLEDKLRVVARRLADGAGYAVVRFHLSADTMEACDVTGSTFDQRFLDEWDAARDGGAAEIMRLVEQTKRPVIVDDIATDSRFSERQRAIAGSAAIGSALYVPMLSQKLMIGILSVATLRDAHVDARDARFLQAVAEQVTAIARMESLVRDLEASASRLRDARSDTVMMLAAAAEAHDEMTGRHLMRVRATSELLAGELGQSEDEIQTLGLAAMLHDIGKIRVPESILLSPARLGGGEWTVMKQHTTWGAEFLRQRPGFELAAIIAQHHHERWDGTGYPNGLAAEAIPPAASIVTVADSLDAITNDRPYRTGRPLRWAIGEIMRCSGAQFSPQVVDALVRLYRAGHLDFMSTDPELAVAA